jgi:thioesterase DpgC
MATPDPLDAYLSAGIGRAEAERLASAPPEASGDLDLDWSALRAWLAPRADALARLPRKPARSAAEQLAAAALIDGGRRAREAFLHRHAAAVYDRLTLVGGRRRLLRLGDLAYLAAAELPGLVPTRAEVARERELPQMHQDGLQIDQGLFLSHVFSDRERGLHLLHAMRQPTAAALDRLGSFRGSGRAELPSMTLERRDGLGRITFHHQDWLNAEDDEYQEALETLVDLVLLDDGIRVAVLRGAPMTKKAYAGRRIFGAGINLTKLYEGQISLLRFMLERETGPLAKIYRGLAREDFAPDAPEDGLEKPFIGAVDGFAIGGHCQVLLVLDRVIAERGAYFNLPARREGIIPGVANLRLPRFVGERAARQGIFFNRDFPADSPEGRLLCDEVVEGDSDMEPAISRSAAELQSAGTTSLLANRRALRVGAEPIDVFRQYLATYCREQAYCLYSPSLIDNLVRNWKGRRSG